ncbi:uncharacterized protein YdeI (YjbR/CyaY-like superfamily) [Clostridium acetobutylicum]|uniref:hypothetical protein n=1 Tax=Clostridium TaxID=1485 RepID=UPI000200C075|nr:MULTISPECIES: hypothetical protein [Clostridium]ADZ22610.1 conserved hypothetical protein [Clostridium acetobutylicum EA 2018]AEI32936.1 conserved hypothetical protein [Clostridium acetobutylicum DSM 1731]MBC2393837.1 hypothetical protein [Clostridium acetobutylicum]MBC2585634.1 hypothetical protein [Clostridium acetobutylicum]NOV87363.1 uncharacterized protein YdeI (YjbR/CyaY-like superfamily) [Clostridium acetobutylicum]
MDTFDCNNTVSKKLTPSKKEKYILRLHGDKSSGSEMIEISSSGNVTIKNATIWD